MNIYEYTFIVLVLCMILIFLVAPYAPTSASDAIRSNPPLIEEGRIRDIAVDQDIAAPLYGDIPVSVPLPNRFRYHQPYYHRMMMNYPYYDPYYDAPLPHRQYCLRYPGCRPCPNWRWMETSICPYRR